MSASVLILVGIAVIVALLLANKVLESGTGATEVIAKERSARTAGLARRFEEVSVDQAFDASHVGLDGRGAVAFHEGDDRIFVAVGRWDNENGKAMAQPEVRTLALRSSDIVDVAFREMSVVRGDKKDTSDRIYALEVLLFIDDVHMPVVPLAFVDTPVFAGSLTHENARDRALHWEGVLKALGERGRRKVRVSSELSRAVTGRRAGDEVGSTVREDEARLAAARIRRSG